MEAVVDEGADVVQVKRSHLGDPPGGVLKGCQTDVKVDLVQVSAVKRVQLETRRALKCGATTHTATATVARGWEKRLLQNTNPISFKTLKLKNIYIRELSERAWNH